MCGLKATQEHLGYVLCVHTLIGGGALVWVGVVGGVGGGGVGWGGVVVF